MPYRSRYTQKRIIFCFCMILFAGLFQSVLTPAGTMMRFIACRFSVTVYVGMIIYWMRSLRRRILTMRIVYLLYVICYLLLFWLVLREARYVFFLNEPVVCHYAWYLYYVPQILVPLLGFYAIVLTGKKEGEKIPGELKALWIPAVALIVMVLTNDLHQQVFSFAPDALLPENLMEAASVHDFEMGYVMIMAWIISILLAGILLLYSNSTAASNRSLAIVPVIIFQVGFIMCILGGLGLQNVFHMPEMFSITYVLSFESCIEIGLIPTNGGYDRFFRAAGFPAKLVNDAGETVYTTASSLNLSALREPEWKIREVGVSGGTMIWAEDLREINRLNEHLEEIREQLSQDFELMQAENELEEHKVRTREKARLFDTLSGFLTKHLPHLSEVVESAEHAKNPDRDLANACLITVYLKRRSNLMLFAGEDKKKGGAEFHNCLRETTVFLNLYGVSTSFNGRELEDFTTDDAIVNYDFLIEFLSGQIGKLSFLTMYLDNDKSNPTLRLMMEGTIDPMELVDYDAFEEDGTIYVNLPIMKGGVD